MNVVFLSPAFPPTAHLFCGALRDRGVRVLGLGDEPFSHGRAEFSALTEYVFEPRMAEYEVLRRAVAGLRERHGAIDRIDSNGERWLDAEARLRSDFDVAGLKTPELRRHRSKLGMAQTFGAAGVPYPRTIAANAPDSVRRFADEHGFPLVFKPDAGSGAVDTFAVATPAELEKALKTDLSRHLVQPFIEGEILTFDGLTDREGHVVFSTSHTYDTGIMQVRRGQLDGHYYSLRTIPDDLEQLGLRAVRAFDLRERFFHIEFFARPSGSYMALECNLRPPGGFTTEMMNFAADIDVYSLWARVLTDESLREFRYERKYHTAHAGRRRGRTYRLSRDELVRELGPTLVSERSVPAAFADTMGDTAYLLRHAELAPLQHAIGLVHAT